VDKLSSWKMTGITTRQWPENNAEIHQKKLDSEDIVVQLCPTGVQPDNVGHCKDLETTSDKIAAHALNMHLGIDRT
jgi:hypothetical protein